MTWILFLVFLTACFSAGATGSMFPPGAWYDRLKKPSWTPPNFVFPIAWLILYLCMATAATRVAMLPGAGLALALWALQLAFNVLWTPTFFGLRHIAGGGVVISFLWLSVAACTVALWQLDQLAGILFVPYLVWVSIAAALNFSVLFLNFEEAMVRIKRPTNASQQV